jgi:hypothetical protein
MDIIIHPHAKERIRERGATEEEVFITIKSGERFIAKHRRIGFRRVFPFHGIWRGKRYTTKQIEVISAQEGENLIVITVLVKYFHEV